MKLVVQIIAMIPSIMMKPHLRLFSIDVILIVIIAIGIIVFVIVVLLLHHLPLPLSLRFFISFSQVVPQLSNITSENSYTAIEGAVRFSFESHCFHL